MSSQELKELSDLRRKNRVIYEQVEELRRSLNLQIKLDAGKATHLPERYIREGDGRATDSGRKNG